MQLRYIQYYNEDYGTFADALATARATLPTDIVVSFGIWQHYGLGNESDFETLPSFPPILEVRAHSSVSFRIQHQHMCCALRAETLLRVPTKCCALQHPLPVHPPV